MVLGQTPWTEKPTWTPEDAQDVIRSFAASGAAVVQGQIVWIPPGRAEPAHIERWQGVAARRAAMRWWICRREREEGWDAFVRRCSEHASRQLAELASEMRGLRNGELRVDLAWVTEDELSLFDLPGYYRKKREEIAGSGTFGSIPQYVEEFWAGAPINGLAMMRTSLAGRVRPGSFSGGPAEDMAQIPADARYAKVHAHAAGLRTLPDRTHLDALEIRHGNDRQNSVIAGMTHLRELRIGRLERLEMLRDFSQLQVAEVYFDPCTAPVDVLASLPGLRYLKGRADDDVAPYRTLRQLRGLHLSWVKGVQSLSPLAELTQLRHLRLFGDRVLDGSLAPLTHLQNLEYVMLDLMPLPMGEYVNLIAHLPRTRGLPRTPLLHFDTPSNTDSPLCPKCRGEDRVRSLTKPQRKLCPHCDRERIAKLVVEWELAIAAAMSGAP